MTSFVLSATSGSIETQSSRGTDCGLSSCRSRLIPEFRLAEFRDEPRVGQMYAMLEREAKEAGLLLNWSARLPNTRRALAAAAWTRRHYPRAFPQLHKELFEAHFVLGEDLDDPDVVDRHAFGSGIDLAALQTALADGSAEKYVVEDETVGRQYGVQGTPAWLLGERLIVGLRPAAEFERLAEYAAKRL